MMYESLLASAKRILLLSPHNMGDLICSLPLITYCKQHSKAKLALVTGPYSRMLTPYLNHLVDEHIYFQNKRWQRYLSLAHLTKRYRKQFDLSICGLEPRKSNHLLMACLSKQQINYTENNWHGRLISHGQMFTQDMKQHVHDAVFQLRAIAPHMNDIPTELTPTLTLPYTIRTQHEQDIERWCYSSTPTFKLLVSVSSRRQASDTLTIEKYAHVLNAVADFYPIKVLISCLRTDIPRAQALSLKLKTDNVIAATPNFEKFICLLAKADGLFIAEGGNMHLAAALNKPQVTLFGSSPYDVWYPLASNASIIQNKTDINAIDDAEITRRIIGMIKNDGRFAMSPMLDEGLFA